MSGLDVGAAYDFGDLGDDAIEISGVGVGAVLVEVFAVVSAEDGK